MPSFPANSLRDAYTSESSLSWTDYRNYRPAYPDAIYDIIAEYLKQHNQTDKKLCVDYGAGDGVTAPGLLDRCGIQKVLATDVSERQLDEAKARLQPLYGEERFATLRGAAGDLSSIEDNSVDLVTAAECVHWFDRSNFPKETARILKPSGTIALWHYRPQCFITSPPEAAPACNKAFERGYELSTGVGVIPKESAILSVSLYDSLVLDSAMFYKQSRHKWMLPNAVSERIDSEAEFTLTFVPPDERDMTAGLRAAGEDVTMQTNTPKDGERTLLQRENWRMSDLLQYMKTVGIPIDKLLSDPIFLQHLKEIEEIVGGPKGIFDVSWPAVLVLATRR